MSILKPVRGGGALAHARPTERRGEIVVKHPVESFADGSQLTVDTIESAVFAQGTRLVGIVGEGRHTLSAKHLPFLQPVYDPATGAYVAALFFVTAEPMHIELGGPLRGLVDAAGRSTDAVVSGSYTLTVADPARLAGSVGEATAETLGALLGPKLLALVERCANEWLQSGYFTLDAIDQLGQPMARALPAHCTFLADHGLELAHIDSLAIAKG